MTGRLEASFVTPVVIHLRRTFPAWQHVLAPVVHDLLQAVDVQQDVIQVGEQVFLFQIDEVSGAGVQVRTGDVVVDTDAASSAAALGHRSGLLAAGDHGRVQVHAARVPVYGCAVGRGQALDGQGLGESSRLVISGDVHDQIFIGAEFIPAVLLRDFVRLRCAGEDVNVLEVHAAALVVSPVSLALLQAGRADGAAAGVAAAFAARLGWRVFFIGQLRSAAVSVDDLNAAQCLQRLGFLLEHRGANVQGFASPCQSSLGAQGLHAPQKVFGADAASLAVLVSRRVVAGDLVGGVVRHGDGGAVGHCRRVRAGAVGAVRVLGAEPQPVATASAALAVQRRHLGLAEVGQDALAAGGGFQRAVIAGGLSLLVVLQKAVDVL